MFVCVGGGGGVVFVRWPEITVLGGLVTDISVSASEPGFASNGHAVWWSL